MLDVIVIGGGHNGLTCGAYLARSGKKVLVLERRPMIGGAAVTEEFAPGFRTSTFSYVMSLLHPKVIRDLGLRDLGLTVLPATDLFCPIGTDDHIVFSGDVRKTAAQFARFSRHDGEIYPEFDAWLNEAANIVRRLLLDTPVDPSRSDFKGRRELFRLAWKYRRIGKKFYRLMDLLTMSADDFLARWFEHSVTRAVLGYYCSIGTFAGPKTPGSAYVVLHHIMGEHEGAGGWGFIRGGMGAISEAIAESGRRHGMEIRTDAEVVRIEVAAGRASKVVTANGEEFTARAVVGNASCKILFDRLVAPEHLPADFLKHIRDYRTFSTAFKINVAAEAPPRFPAFDAARCGFDAPNYIHIGPTVEYLQAAYEDACQGRYSSRPFITAVVPTTVDDTLAPPREACRESVRRPCAVCPQRPRLERRTAGIREKRIRHDRRAGAGLQRRHHRKPGPAAPGHRANHQHAAGTHLSRRAGARAALLPAARSSLLRLPVADSGPVPMRLFHASRWRRIRHSGSQCGTRDPAGLAFPVAVRHR